MADDNADIPVQQRYSGIVCDLDGVIYRGQDAVPHAVDALNSASLPTVYATNNASRTPQEVAAHLLSLGLHTDADHVVNSSMAGAQELADRLPPGSRVLAVGGPGVSAALTAAGLTPTAQAREPVAAVLQGYGADVRAADLAEAAYAIHGGALWVATNDDLTLPTDRGIAPGNGSLVAAVATATGTRPAIMGKPQPPLYLMSSRVLGLEPRRVLAIGDRLETDIAGASAAGMDAALVLTGVHGVRDAALAPPSARPRYLLADLRGLAQPYAEPHPEHDGFRCRGVAVHVEADTVHVVGEGADPLDVARAGLAALWARAEAGVSADRLRVLADQLPEPA